jgi:crotonobetainyl-CoA:carnitine CoA-transferase CaiB-like acyl-CoA transferase
MGPRRPGRANVAVMAYPSEPRSDPDPSRAAQPLAPTGPLAGVRVLDLTSVIMGPYATQLLGDMGADVIAVEPGRGDTNRSMGAGPHRQLSGVSLNLLRNKRNVSIDFKHPDGRQAVLDIAATCDVVITNLRPGPLKRAGLAYGDVAAVRPDVIYCQAHGYRSDGPRGDEPAYDDVIQAESGIADAAAKVTGQPQLAPTLLADKVCGLTIAYAVSAALYRRARTGEGEHIEVPMLDTVEAFTLVEHGAAAVGRPPQGPAGYPRILNPHRRPWPTKDGWMVVLPYSKEHYDRIFTAAGREDLLGDERYRTGRNRIANAPFLYDVVGRMLAERTTAEWVSFFREQDVPAGEVSELDNMVDALPDADHPIAGTYKLIPPPVRFARAPQNVRRPAPLIGEHTDEVLAEVGYDQGRVATLRESGALGWVPTELS